jgi:CRP/FNR family transcriptional regulator
MKLKRKYMLDNNSIQFSLDEKAKILAEFVIFEGISYDDIKKIADKMSPRIIRPMEIFIEEGISINEAFFIYKGAVSIFRMTEEGEIINIDLEGAPELVGELSLVDSNPSPVNAMAIEETYALVLSQNDFQNIITLNPIIALKLLEVFAARIRNFDYFLEHLLSHNLYERTWYMLQHLGSYFPNKEITLSQEQLDDLIWGTRSRITEVLNKLEKEGKIEVKRRKIRLIS